MNYPGLARYIPVLAMTVASTALGSGVSIPGIPNFHQVNENIFRGAQPGDQAWQGLANIGVKVVVDLRREGEDDEHSTAREAQLVEAAGMRYVHVPMKGMKAPTDEQISKVMALFTSGERVFVHCKKGKDRTGTVVACYRIQHEQWHNKQALREAKDLGLHWFEMAMKSYISDFKPAPASSIAVTPAPAAVTAQ